MYHEIEEPYALLDRLRAALKPNGRIAIVDLDRATEFHGTPKPLLACEVKAVGYELVTMTELNPGLSGSLQAGASSRPGNGQGVPRIGDCRTPGTAHIRRPIAGERR